MCTNTTTNASQDSSAPFVLSNESASSSYMNVALEEAYQGIASGEGGPFGSVVVKNGEIVGRGHNQVLGKSDPTCHGEMQAIRAACATLGTYDLSDCELYTTAEPCPMCLGAIMWANIKTVYYGCTREDSARIGFRDDVFYQQMEGSTTTVELREEDREACLRLFDNYVTNDPIRY